jgi:peptidoglycan/xylan/chitin deacetylase (PgdA/CDA1 family)
MFAVRPALQHAVKYAAVARDSIRRLEPGIVVLIYHRVGAGSRSEIDLPVPAFEEQMAWLAFTGRVVSLADALHGLAGSGESITPDAPPKVVVTFDDGTADLLEHAAPILERHSVPATLYLATRFVDEGIAFPGDAVPLSWAGVRELAAGGCVDIGSHTHGHKLLDRLPPAAVADELDRSIELIGEHVGRAPLDFAYPKAVPGSLAAHEAVRTRFRSAALAGTRPNRYGRTDPYRLARSPVQVSDGTRWFVRKALGGMQLEDDLRDVLNRRRYASSDA